MKDRKSKYPGRVLLTPEDGSAPFYAIITRADEPEEDGDAINKKNLLQDSTAEAIGLDPDENPQVNDALAMLNYNHERRYRVGDIVTSVRTDLGEKWALCNGDPVYRDAGTNPEFYKLLDPGIDPRTINLARSGAVGRFTDMGNGMWCNYERWADSCAVIDPLTGGYTAISNAANGLAGQIVGVVWDGGRYVLCSIVNDTSIYFYTSGNLITWTKAAEHAPDKEPGWSSTYGTVRFVWDGAAYRVACQYIGYQAHYVHTYNANFDYLGYVPADYSDIYAAEGLFVIGGSGGQYQFVSLYEPGSITPLKTRSIVGDDAYSALVFEKYYGDNYVAIPLLRVYATRLTFYNKAANAYSEIAVSSIASDMAYLVRVHIDKAKGELLFVLRPEAVGTNTVLKLARIKLSADMTNAANYSVSVYDSYDSTTVTTLNNLARFEGELTYLSDAYSTVTIAGPHPRRLPAITHEDCYTYIKIEEGE